MYRKIERTVRSERPHWVGNGFYVHQYFPRGAGGSFLDRFSPFILMDYNAPYFFNGTDRNAGVGVHPHRGFETVTFALAGKVEHRDNAGNSGVIEPGDVQWMTAGSGVLHNEYHEKEWAKNNRVLHMIQLWVNLPRKDKMTAPKYQAITADRMGKVQISEDGGDIIVYAGEVDGVKGPASTFSPMNIYKIRLEKGKRYVLHEKKEFNLGILMLSGKVKFNDQDEAVEQDFVLFMNDADRVMVEGIEEESELFVLSGEPLGEPIVAMGPFVMNTLEEIGQANNDYQTGKFGDPNF